MMPPILTLLVLLLFMGKFSKHFRTATGDGPDADGAPLAATKLSGLSASALAARIDKEKRGTPTATSPTTEPKRAAAVKWHVWGSQRRLRVMSKAGRMRERKASRDTLAFSCIMSGIDRLHRTPQVDSR